VPGPDDIDPEDGFGYFDRVWTILGVTVGDAQKVLRQDRILSTLVGGIAANEHDFEVLAAAAETGSPGDDEIPSEQLTLLADHFPDAQALEGLEIGVAGLVYALAAAGMYPAASCRGHADPNAWSRSPVVFFVADRPHAEALTPLVREARCGFALDPSRPDFLAICASSIQEMLGLAQDILSDISRFASVGGPDPSWVQGTIFDF
jgi:hypothetical protein